MDEYEYGDTDDVEQFHPSSGALGGGLGSSLGSSDTFIFWLAFVAFIVFLLRDRVFGWLPTRAGSGDPPPRPSSNTTFPAPSEQEEYYSGPDAIYVRIRLPQHNDMTRVVRVSPDTSVGDLSEYALPAEAEASDTTIRLISSGQVLFERNATLRSVGVTSDSVIHAVAYPDNHMVTIFGLTIPFHLAAKMVALWLVSSVIGISWYLALAHPHLVGNLSKLMLSFLTLVFLIALYNFSSTFMDASDAHVQQASQQQ